MNDAPRNSRSTEYYRQLLRVRTFEERVGELFVRGGTAGSMLHLSIGEEAAAVGVTAHMGDGDSFTTHHRGHGIFLARGADPNRMMAEIAGAESGYCAGKGGSMHIADRELGHLGANAIVGGGIPAVIGAGLSARHFKSNAVSVAFFGDGAAQQGVLYESMNMAALWSLPCLFVCINNQYGMGTKIDRSAARTEFEDRATAFGLRGARADGGDVEKVAEVAGELIEAARAGAAGFLVVDCYRFHGHARMDKSPYRDDAEETEGRKTDPLALQRRRLIEDALLSESQCDEIAESVTEEMDAAVDFAIKGRQPAQDALFQDVYAPGQPAPEPVDQRIAKVLAE
ncbi:thiamine pyrophosphate-dependent dehydrogenase E1 component subunit alpha [Pelagibius sp. Alg239-R121]|uniref:thiamine pyrophosphate-dependent dehydrogenase E1 component subunit alpha n=1 Tax=Pelagibius sp. Alg239-R121 TaxID=2993448 RepID=UPI0024A763C8|nr:thiamine pyrophosphate-dependent enzyme [Pelagibius sp. Alg239-R121]